MIPSFLKKQRKNRDKHSPPTSPASFFSPSLERSPDTSPPPPLPIFPTSTSNPTSFPHPTRLAWPPPQSLASSVSSQQKPQALPVSPPRPPALSITTATSSQPNLPNTTTVNGLGSPEIQLDLGFTSESLLDGFTGFFDRSTSSVRTGSTVAPVLPPGVQGAQHRVRPSPR